MRTPARLGLWAATVLWTVPVQAATQAATHVTFVNTERTIEARRAPGALGELRRHLEQLGETLDPRLSLRIAVLDVRLAGREPFGRGALAPRIMDRVNWPAMEVRYTLTRGGKVVASGEERIADQAYRMRPATALSSVDPLRYEKAMLNRWFDARFAAYRAEAPQQRRRR